MLEPKLKYDFPKGNSDPFTYDYNGDYFAYANAFSNLSNNLDDFSLTNLGKNIPMGYKTIILQKRICAISEGKVIKKFFSNSEELNGREFFLTCEKAIKFFRKDWNAEIDTNVIYKPEAEDASLNSSIWNDLDECIAYAKMVSQNENCQILISEVIDSISWH